MLKTFQRLPSAIWIKSNSCLWHSRLHDLALAYLSDFIFLLLSHCSLFVSHTGLHSFSKQQVHSCFIFLGSLFPRSSHGSQFVCHLFIGAFPEHSNKVMLSSHSILLSMYYFFLIPLSDLNDRIYLYIYWLFSLTMMYAPCSQNLIFFIPGF